jgi:hydroxypyruvate reductase
VGDDPTHIASGPCTPDPTTIEDAKAVLAKYGIEFRGPFSETPKTASATNKVIATAYRSLEAAAEVFRRQGIRPEILGDTITGEARDVGREMARLARRTKGPAALISGGECTVTVKGEGGRGGRCTEFLLSLGIETQGIWAIAADTDGIDGTEDNAGAILTPESMKRGQDGEAFLARHDSYGFFSALGDLVVTGPTRTNVNDYRAILVG